MRAGAKLSAANVNAIVNLVASAVEGLGPEAITLVDSRGTLLNRPRKSIDGDGAQSSEALLEYRQRIEADLRAKINATLEPIVGAEKFRAGVSVDCDLTSGEQSEETVDPNKSVMLTSQKTEETTGAATVAGTPGTASNLPRPPAHSSGSNGVSRRTENIAYQTSRTVRHVKLPQGTIKRISISVLVDHDLKWEGAPKKQKRVITAPAPERLKSIRELVSAVVGLNTERGDQLVVESLPFEATLSGEPPSSEPAAPVADPRVPKWLLPLIADPKSLIIFAVAAALLPLMLIAWVLMRKRKPKAGAESPTALPGNSHSTPGVAGNTGAEEQIEAPVAPQYKLPKVTTKKSEILLTSIRESIAKDSSNTINVLRTWLADIGGNESE
jgi:flagellar M-ring protein FliF